MNIGYKSDKYSLFLYENYSKRMKETAREAEFKTNHYDELALAMMGMGHMLGMRFILWERDDLNPERFRKIAHFIMYGYKGGKNV